MQGQSEAASACAAAEGGAAAELVGVVSVREGDVVVSSATVTFGEGAATDASTAAESTAAAAQDAVKLALLALRGALGVERPPSAVVALTSLRLPRPAAAAAVAALRQQLGADTPVLGCSSRLRLPDERRSLGLTAPPGRASPSSDISNSSSSSGSSAETENPVCTPSLSAWPDAASAATAAANAAEPYHLTLAAAHTPHHEAHVLHCETSSLPRLPHLAEALRGTRPPAFLLLTAADGVGSELLSRLENLFPGSCVGAGVAAQQSARDRRLLLVGGPGRSTGSNSGSGSGSGSGGGSSPNSAAAGAGGGGGGGGLKGARAAAAEAAVSLSAAEAATRGTAAGGAASSGGTSSGGGGSGGGGGGRRSGRGIPAAEFEGPFQRMLLNRDDSAASISEAGSDDAGSPSTSGRTDYSNSSSSSSSSSSSGAGRRRKPPATAAAQAESKAASQQQRGADTAAAVAAGCDVDSDTDDDDAGADEGEDAAAAAVAARLQALLPPYAAVGDELHNSGSALLAFFPRAQHVAPAAPAVAAAAAPATASASAGAAGAVAAAAAGRLAAAACDSLARVVLGTDHLQHVALRGAALGAISPPATGLEPFSPLPAAPDNPYYWWPADPAPPHHVVDPHLARPPAGAAAGATAAGAGTGAAAGGRAADDADAGTAAKAAATGASAGAAGGTGQQAAAAAAGTGEVGDQEEVPSAKALSALSEGLVGLPLFPLEGAILFPGQTIQLRVFEKRYRLLVRAAMEQGAAFGLCWRGTGTTAVVRSYQCPEGGAGDVLVMLEGGVRFSYGPDDLAVLPASFGLNVAKRAEYLVDDPPPTPEDAAAMVSAARQILDGVAGALEAATTPSAQKTARTFANALHFASSGSSSNADGDAPGPGPAPAPAAAAAAPSAQQAPSPSLPPQQPGAAKQLQLDASRKDEDEALLAADVAEAKGALDVETASLLSLYLAPHIPVHLEGLRREWYTTRSALWRLQQEASWLRGNSRVCMAVASSVLRLPRDHPLRLMLGLSRVSPVQ
ncbi:hypothetical protein HXX76_011797 [Chlamydomonas incerta]|uniref:Lon N-terminal domain-containing protein n=1 Tax=Chlamydomonas incerta TaxID=51695 RepID=A0A835SM47_CHLIN|nr:hypothetical protein HXX76_011797 [Chlamydomonas incerta]|eukprot:KAG2428116.1 hypothetical protein HXX76_011797 [Chlamydomonas incerta]